MPRIGHIFRWDLDKTYLKTEFATIGDLVRTARLSAEERENIPGAAALIRAIRDLAPGEVIHQVFFISGSPEQLRSTIEKKFALDGIAVDGFALKPTLSHLLRGRFRAVRGQVGYKLFQLLAGRAEAPVGAHETLFGDDAESDAFVYSLYADVLAGRASISDLRKILKKAGAYGLQIREIEGALESIVREDPVTRIMIHLDQRTPPIAFQPFFPRVVPIYNHLQTAIVLYLDGTLPAACIRSVARELMQNYGFDVQRLTNVAEDILRRRRMYHPQEALPALAEDLRALPPLHINSDQEAALEEETTHVVARIADSAEHLGPRPLPEEIPVTEPRTDYLELWELERERQEELKRARKLASKISRDEEREAARRAAAGAD